MRGYAVAGFSRRVMFTCSGLCRLYPFCSFLLIKVLRSPVPFRREQRLFCAFSSLRRIFSSRNATSLTLTHSEQLAAIFLNNSRYHVTEIMLFEIKLRTICSSATFLIPIVPTWKAVFVIPLNAVTWESFSVTPYQIWLPQQQAWDKNNKIFTVSLHFLSRTLYLCCTLNIMCPLLGGCFLYQVESKVKAPPLKPHIRVGNKSKLYQSVHLRAEE